MDSTTSQQMETTNQSVGTGNRPVLRRSVRNIITPRTISYTDCCISCSKKYFYHFKDHPLLEAKVCTVCYEKIVAGIGLNCENLQMCVICGKDGYIACNNYDCEITGMACQDCIKKFYGFSNNWQCFFCSENSILIKKSNWEQKLFSITVKPTVLQKQNEPIHVLSLFDGIGSGYVSLRKLGLHIQKYYASEVDPSAQNVCVIRSNGRVSQIGDVRDIDDRMLDTLGKIDLLVGGSPCTELSLVNPARRGLFDLMASGVLFFEYIRILNELKIRNPGVLFLFENTAAMELNTKRTISRFLECEPILLDSKLFCPMKRARLFWTNLPLLNLPNNGCMKNLGDYLTKNCGRSPLVPFIRTITTNKNSLTQGLYRQLPVLMNGKEDELWITELEKIFGFDEHYTDVCSIAHNKRFSLLGSSWSIPVICFLFKRLLEIFPTEIDLPPDSLRSLQVLSYNSHMKD